MGNAFHYVNKDLIIHKYWTFTTTLIILIEILKFLKPELSMYVLSFGHISDKKIAF